jgi:hypothetical protein
MLPPTLKRFFWDTPFEAIDRNANKSYIISRLLELGDEAAIAWLQRHYSRDDLRRVTTTSRDLSQKSRNYWKFKFHVA